MRALGPVLLVVFAFAAAPAAAQTHITTHVYERCAAVGEASVVEVVVAPCAEAEALAVPLVAAPPGDAAGVLAAAGWTALRARATSSGTQHDLVALRGAAALRIRRSAAAPDLDGWGAGRELIFARPRLVAGGRAPSGSALCTSAFLVRFPNGSFGGLSAAHCGGLRSDGTVHRRYVALRRPPQAGIVLGRVQRILTRTQPYDALVVPVPGGVANRSRVAVVDRGVSRPPWRVTGSGQPSAGRAVCYAGRTSGIDQCGRIRGSGARRAERVLSAFAGVVVRCTTIRAREGDSGGPVYSAPRADGSVSAIGIVTLVVGSSARMCFTPLAPVLNGLNAELVVTSG
jgi:hypothetical protein